MSVTIEAPANSANAIACLASGHISEGIDKLMDATVNEHCQLLMEGKAKERRVWREESAKRERKAVRAGDSLWEEETHRIEMACVCSNEKRGKPSYALAASPSSTLPVSLMSFLFGYTMPLHFESQFIHFRF